MTTVGTRMLQEGSLFFDLFKKKLLNEVFDVVDPACFDGLNNQL